MPAHPHRLDQTARRKALALTFFMLALSAVTEGAQSGQPVSAIDDRITTIRRLLATTGLPFTVNGDGSQSWLVTYDGDTGKRTEVSVTLSGDLVVIETVVARVDSERSLAVLTKVRLSDLEPAGFKQMVSRVAGGVNDVAGLVKTASAASSSDPSGTLSLLQGRAVVRYDRANWTPAAVDKPGIFTFKSPDGDLGIKILAERTEIPAANMKTFVLEGFKKFDAAARIAREGWRDVNGSRLLWLEIEATVSGAPVTFYSHCYNGPNATIQLIGYSGRSVMAQSRPLIEEFVAGFEVAAR
jgi:hypothetical protein